MEANPPQAVEQVISGIAGWREGAVFAWSGIRASVNTIFQNLKGQCTERDSPATERKSSIRILKSEFLDIH